MLVLAGSFYDDVLRELVTALGAALFLCNLLALIRRGSDRRRAATRAEARTRPGSPVRGKGSVAAARVRGDLPEAPVLRSVAFLVFGLVVMVWGIASIVGS